MRLQTASGPTETAYLDGVEFSAELAGVFFALAVSSGGSLACIGVHPESEGHMDRYDTEMRSVFFDRAARRAASNDNPPLYDENGAEAWVA
jgi:hypothetical protein